MKDNDIKSITMNRCMTAGALLSLLANVDPDAEVRYAGEVYTSEVLGFTVAEEGVILK